MEKQTVLSSRGSRAEVLLVHVLSLLGQCYAVFLLELSIELSEQMHCWASCLDAMPGTRVSYSVLTQECLRWDVEGLNCIPISHHAPYPLHRAL